MASLKLLQGDLKKKSYASYDKEIKIKYIL